MEGIRHLLPATETSIDENKFRLVSRLRDLVCRRPPCGSVPYRRISLSSWRAMSRDVDDVVLLFGVELAQELSFAGNRVAKRPTLCCLKQRADLEEFSQES